MADSEKDFAGKGGFTWWIGIVEDRQDPLKMGRLKVRCVGWHADNRMEVPVDGLPWAMSMLPTNNTSPYPPNVDVGITSALVVHDGELLNKPPNKPLIPFPSVDVGLATLSRKEPV